MSWTGFIYANIIFGLITLFLVFVIGPREPAGYGSIAAYQMMQVVYFVFLGSAALLYFGEYLACEK